MRITIFLAAFFLLASCQQHKGKQITKVEDYGAYLTTQESATTSKYFEIWNSKIKPDSMQLISLGVVAGEYNRYFSNTGEIGYLKQAEKALKKAVSIAAIGKADYLRALARNYISQHRFKEALPLATAARQKGSGMNSSLKLLFDIHMELGSYDTAEKYLDSIRNRSDFGYLIRLAKWNDHKGDLSTTIRLMERAKNMAETANNKELLLWSYTNLADFYGHSGNIAESYRYYLKTLAIAPTNAYAKKGIAWIVFSYEKNPKEALRILDAITQTYKGPDFYLLKADIAAYMHDERNFLVNLDNYYKAVNDTRYGGMFNMANASLLISKTGQYKKGIALATEEVNNRPTPETFALLAYGYMMDGQIELAAEIVDSKILGKTFEPRVLLQAAEVYKAAGKTESLPDLKAELGQSAYELGPLQVQRIKAL